MKGIARLLTAMVALWGALPAAAQAPAPQTSDTSGDNTIVVTGKSGEPSRGEVSRQARDISRVSPYQVHEESLPRFWQPVCPGVAGLNPDAAATMLSRIRANVERLKLPLAGGGCSPNLIIAFVDDGRSLLADLKRNQPAVFRSIPPSEQTEMLSENAPVHVWNNLAMRWTGAGPPPRHGEKPSVWGQLNRQFMPEAPDIVSALVVFNRDAVIGMTLEQLADYATMRGLAHTRPVSGGQPMTTILSLFDNGGGSPDALTSFDAGYLRSLYALQPNLPAVDKFLGVSKWAAKSDAAPRAHDAR
jgi:hypothetical protein